jgi:hypothetical protein
VLKPRILFALPHDKRRKLFARIRPAKFERLQQKRAIDSRDGYTYKPYDEHRCIFVHIPKAAGMSICRSLFGNLAGGHATLADYQVIFSKHEFDDYFKFSFVRNPWDRVLSAYHFLCAGGVTEHDRNWAHHIRSYTDFDNFVLRGLRTTMMRNRLHFRSQSSFLRIPYNAQIPLDFLGYFENIQQDFDVIRQSMGLDNTTALRHVNKTTVEKVSDFRDAFTDQTRQIVADVYAEDIELLGYSFDNSTLPLQLQKRKL